MPNLDLSEGQGPSQLCQGVASLARGSTAACPEAAVWRVAVAWPEAQRHAHPSPTMGGSGWHGQ